MMNETSEKIRKSVRDGGIAAAIGVALELAFAEICARDSNVESKWAKSARKSMVMGRTNWSKKKSWRTSLR